MGLKIESLGDLMSKPAYLINKQGVDVAPDTDSSL